MRLFTLLLSLTLLAGNNAFSQWLDTANRFNDSLHMPVSLAAGNQERPIVVKSDDGGYFLIWEDQRNTSTTKQDIYAQKYDKNGKRLWADGGVPVANSPNQEMFQTQNFNNYRHYGIGAPDGAGGLFVCWTYLTTLQSMTNAYGVAVQHLRPDGTQVFGPIGNTVAAPFTGYEFFDAQLIADSKGGFFLGYKSIGNAWALYLNCYTDEGGTLKYHGGGIMNVYGAEQTTNSPCGTPQYSVSSQAAQTPDFMIYPDLQGGCNIVMAVEIQSTMYYAGYNRLCRVKKDCHTTVVRRQGTQDPATTHVVEKDYKKDSVVQLYNFTTYSYNVTCSPPNQPTVVYDVLNTRIENDGYGYLPLNLNAKYYVDLPYGVILPTGGNINAEIISTFEQGLDGNGARTNYHTHGYYRDNEIYDSLPYELCSDADHPYQAFRPVLPVGAPAIDTLLPGPDTLIGHTNDRANDNYVMSGSGNKAWVSVRASDATAGTFNIYLQELKLAAAGTKKYRYSINTNDPLGIKLVQENYTGSPESNLNYTDPEIAVDDNGHAMFYAMEAARYVKVSPIGEGGVLSWGGMGKALGSGYWGGMRSNLDPMAVLSNDGTALVGWDEDRQLDGVSTTGQNVWMEHVTNVFTPSYLPPLKTLMALTSGSSSVPAWLSGATNLWTEIDGVVYQSGGNDLSTPLISVLDNTNLGFMRVQTFDNTQPIRVVNGMALLDRNFLITVDDNPNGSGNIPMRFYIPQAQFDALKAVDAAVRTPGDLMVIDQPTTSTNVPSTFTPAGNETNLPLTGWGTTGGGYYIEFNAKGFSNFFITRNTTPLPLTWLSINGSLLSSTEAKITWTVTEEKDVKMYTLQYSPNGSDYIDANNTVSTNSGLTTMYSATTPLPAPGTYFFRVRQEDLDGRVSYSRIVVLTSAGNDKLTVSPNPVETVAVLNIPGNMTVKKLTLIGIGGQTVWQSVGTLTGAVRIPMDHLPAGMYELQVRDDKASQVLTVVKR